MGPFGFKTDLVLFKGFANLENEIGKLAFIAQLCASNCFKRFKNHT